MLNSDGQPAGTYNKSQITPAGNGGFNLSVALAETAPGELSLISSHDVCIGYFRTWGQDDEWAKVLREDTVDEAYHSRPIEDSRLVKDAGPPVDYFSSGDGLGTYAAEFMRADAMKCVFSWSGRIWLRDNTTGQVTRCDGFPPLYMPANSGYQRHTPGTIDTHPTNANIFLIGTNSDGAHYTLDQGATSVEISGLPTPVAETSNPRRKHYVAFDPTDGDIAYVSVHGHGIYRSTTGVQGTFSLMAGSPTNIQGMRCCPISGDLYAVAWKDTSGDKLWHWDKSAPAWRLCPGSSNCKAFDISPFDENHIVFIGENGGFSQSTDKGLSFEDHTSERGAGEVGWYSFTDKARFGADVRFDPTQQGRIFMADGVSTNWALIPATGETLTWRDYSRGMEMLITRSYFNNPSYEPTINYWDKPQIRLTDPVLPTNAPVNADNTGITKVQIGQGGDYAIDDNQYEVLSCSFPFDGQTLGYSTDGGRTFTPFDYAPDSDFGFAGTYGPVAVGNRGVVVMLKNNNGPLVYTHDNGRTPWKAISLGSESPFANNLLAYYVNRHVLCADKSRPNTFYVVANGLKAADVVGLWEITINQSDGSYSARRLIDGFINAGSEGNVTTAMFWQALLLAIPNKPGEILFAQQQPGEDAASGNKLVWWDGEQQRDLNPVFRGLGGYAVGAPAPGQSYPTIGAWCQRAPDGQGGFVAGYYQTRDWGRTVQLITRYPHGDIGSVESVGAHHREHGTFYLGMSGSGSRTLRYGFDMTLAAA